MATKKSVTTKLAAAAPKVVKAAPSTVKTVAKTATKTPVKAHKVAAVAKTAVAPKKTSAPKTTAEPVAKAKKAAVAKPRKVPKPAISAEQRSHYIEVAAFYIAERRGFTPGDLVADWLAAEAEIDRLIASGVIGQA